MPSESVPQALVPSFAAVIKQGYFFSRGEKRKGAQIA